MRTDGDVPTRAVSAPDASKSGPSKSETAYRWLRERITARELAPGERLVLEDIGRSLGMSVVPVREAVWRLQAEGYVHHRRHAGAQVATIDPEQYLHSMQTLALLEGYATATGAVRIPAAELDRAAALNGRLREVAEAGDARAYTELNREFHGVLCRATDNSHLVGMLEREWARLDVIRRSSFALAPDRFARSVAEHDVLLGLIRSCAASEVVEAYARDHTMRTADAAVAALGDEPAPDPPDEQGDP